MNSVKEWFANRFPAFYGQYVLIRNYRYLYLKRRHRRRIRAVRKEKKAKVVVIISNLAMWRLEDVVALLKKDSRFQVEIVVCPFTTFAPDVRKKNVDEVVSYLQGKGWDYILANNQEDSEGLMKALDPDLVFYPQLYSGLYGKGLNLESNLGRLIAYVPYALPTTSGDWSYNSRYFNVAWRLLYPTKLHYSYSRRHSFNHARNMVIVGDSHASAFLKEDHQYPWKEGDRKKKVIWAPHFSIRTDGYLHRASFLWLHQAMWEMAQEFKEKVQFVFKPHPRLLSELYRHPDWGKERADAYFARWKNGENTQLETGPYIDLFCTSDAMVHDCGSFSAEYHYTGKPVLFVSKDFKDIYQGLDDFGTLCMDLHYRAGCLEEIHSFLQDVVLGRQDSRKMEREAFRRHCLIPSEGTSFERNVYQSITRDLFKD